MLPPPPCEKARLRGRAASLATGRDFRNQRGKKSKILARSMTGRLWQELRTKRTRTRTTHRARARGWFPSFTTRATRQRRDTMSQEGGVSARCAATVPAATRAPMPHPTPLLFLLSCARVSRICCRAKENEAARPAVRRRLALAADTPPSRSPPSVPPQRARRRAARLVQAAPRRLRARGLERARTEKPTGGVGNDRVSVGVRRGRRRGVGARCHQRRARARFFFRDIDFSQTARARLW